MTKNKNLNFKIFHYFLEFAKAVKKISLENSFEGIKIDIKFFEGRNGIKKSN